MWKKQLETSKTIVQQQITNKEKDIQVAQMLNNGGELLQETESEEIYLSQHDEIIRFYHIYNGQPSDDINKYLTNK